MITKYLVCAKQVFLSSRKPTDYSKEPAPVMELRMPIEIFWEMEELIKKADYLISTGSDFPLVQELHKKVFSLAAAYAAIELDRNMLYEKAGLDKPI